jgi:hypothetical protein
MKKADLKAYRDMLANAKLRVGKLKAQGLDAQAVINAKPFDSYPAAINANAAAKDRFVRTVYEGLTSVYVANLRMAAAH